MTNRRKCAVIGGGPAGLMAAEVLAAGGCAVTLYDRMPTLGRKFLMAGIGGLNLTHSEPIDDFLQRYRGSFDVSECIRAFSPVDLIEWCKGLGHETFVGSSGRIFPTTFKASPLLRAWLQRLVDLGVDFRTRHQWTGWNGEALIFDTPNGPTTVAADATVLAFGGASWPRLGSDGKWHPVLGENGIGTEPLRPANCGFDIGWDEHVGSRFAGTPLKSICLRFRDTSIRGEAVVTQGGIEGSAIYALSASLRDEIESAGRAVLHIDFKPDGTGPELVSKLQQCRSGDSLSNRLRKAGLSQAAIAILREGAHPLPSDATELVTLIKSAPLTLVGTRPIDRAISTAGGVRGDALDPRQMLAQRPGVFVAGEMLDWEAPTGGYLLQGCFASGRQAGHGALAWLSR